MKEYHMPRRTNPIMATIALMALLAFTGCDTDSDPMAAGPGSTLVSLDLQGLKTLGQGLNYQAWLVTQKDNNLIGNPVVLFNVDEDGQMVKPSNPDSLLAGPFGSDVKVPEVLGVAISIEQATKLVAYSSSTFILSGEATGETAILKADDWLAMNRDFSNAGGTYVLGTPTDEDLENEHSGIWFMDNSVTPATAGLQLPDAPEGWVYEGWVEVNGVPLSTGKFVSAAKADSAATYSGTGNAPPFPGEDFLNGPPAGTTFPLDTLAIRGASVYITAEPWQDFDVEPTVPFFVRILEGQVPGEAVAGVQYGLTSVIDQLPSGTATIQGGG